MFNDVGVRFQGQTGHGRVDALHHGLKHRAGAELDELGDAHADELAHRFLPAHGAADLRLEIAQDDVRAIGDFRRVVGDDRHARGLHLRRGEEGLEARRRRRHEARVISPGDLERDGFLHALLLRERGDRFHFLHAARENDLAGAVEVGDVDVAGLRDLARLFRRGAEQRGHGANRGVAGLLHERAALGHEMQAGLESERVRGGVGGVFAKRKPGGGFEAQRLAGVILIRREEREAVAVKRRLAHARLGEDLHRALEAVFGDGPAEEVVGAFVKCPCRDAIFDKISAHADFLGALPGKEQRAGFGIAHKK